MHKNCLLHNAEPRYENKSSLISKHTEKETHSCLWLNNVPVKANGIPFWRWWAGITVTPLHAAAQIINIAPMCKEITSLTIHCIFLFPFHLIHIVWPSASLQAFLPSHEQATHQRHIQQILCEIEQLCSYTRALWVQLPAHAVWFVYVNVNLMNWILMVQRWEIIFVRLETWEHSPSSLLSSLPSPPSL